MYELPVRKHFVQKAVELKKCSKKVRDAYQRRDVIYSPKMDGCHMFVVVEPSGAVSMFSRQGEPVRSCDHIAAEYAANGRRGFVYFGEVMARDCTHTEINGMFRRHSTQLDLRHFVFDAVPLDDFEGGVCESGYMRRLSYAEVLNSRCHFVGSMPAFPTTDLVGQYMAALTGELVFDGVVAWDTAAPWVAGDGLSNANAVKMKDIITRDLRIVGFLYGTGKFDGMLGSFICEYNGEQVRVQGGALTTTERQQLALNPDSFIGSIIEVHALAETEDGKLREPRFSGRWRDDKDEAD